MVCGLSHLSRGKHQSNSAPLRSRESESQNYVRSLVIGLGSAFGRRVSRRGGHGSLGPLYSRPVAMEPKRATEDLWRGGYNCRDHVRMLVTVERETAGHSRRNLTTPAAVGRWEGSSCQQSSVMSHTESTIPSSCASCGRAGRSPLRICKTMNGAFKPLNGFLPVNA